MVEKGIRGGICHAIHRSAKANNKYMKNYDKSKASSFIEYSNVNNLYGWAVSQKLPADCFKDSNKGYTFDVDVEYSKNSYDLHSDLPFLPKRMKINKCNKLVCNLYDKSNYVVHVETSIKSWTNIKENS